MKIVATLYFILSILICASAQNDADREVIISETNVEKLQQISDAYWSTQEKFRNQSVRSVILDSKGQEKFFSHFDNMGFPVYYSLDNDSSARSSKIDRIRTGGSSGLDLNGEGLEIGLWDSGPPRTSHQEFSDNISIIDTVSMSFHATHIAGILVAKGIVPEARGIASSASIRSYTSSGWISEIPLWAAEGGMISSHSYIVANPQEDYEKFGIYNNISRSWDQLSYLAPYLIMCTGASNNGNNNYNPNGLRYDLLASNKLGKNSIVVGACMDVLDYTDPSSVRQAVFTSWGPSDDWRIKPDITAVGTSSFSTREVNDFSYGTGQGSSFAAPIVSGGLALLQQHYHNKNAAYMKAATAKALILSTTDEAGTHDGPDFSNGWGLFNAEKAAEVITGQGTSTIISELTLDQDASTSIEIEVDGTQPLSVAICWNDPPSEPLPGELYNDPTLMLINDLDVRVSSDTTVYLPWRMEPDSSFTNYTAAATRGDNFRDNIEIIQVADVEAGIYTVDINHKGMLQSGAQDFSLIINGIRLDVSPTSDLSTTKEHISVYPNPADKFLTVSSASKKMEELTITISNINGQKQLVEKLISNASKDIDISHLPAGTYIVTVRNEQSDIVSTEQVIIQ